MDHKEIINGLIKDKGITPGQIAKKLGVSEASVSRWRKIDKIPDKRLLSLETLADNVSSSDMSVEENAKVTDLLSFFSVEELTKELSSRSFKVHLEWMGGF